jgi:leader peptidase (prepilin peptidase)/N-methyltransferase
VTLAAALAGAVVGAASGPLLLRFASRFPGVRRRRHRGVVLSVITAVALAALCARLVPDPHARYAVPAFVGLAAVGVALAVIDLDTHRLPNAITLPAYPLMVLLLGVGSWLAGDWQALLRAGLAGVAALALYGALGLAAPQGLGFGDVKLAGLLGLALGWLSWTAAVVGMALGFLVGAVVSLALVAARRASLRTELPYGPWMLTGAWLAVLAGHQLARLYLAW